jgi:hypothetical protein
MKIILINLLKKIISVDFDLIKLLFNNIFIYIYIN